MKSNVILVGPIGTGKDWCCRTLLKEYPDENGRMRRGAGKTVMMLANEPGWDETNGDLTCDMGFHVHQHLPYEAPLDQYLEWLEYIAGRSAADVKEMKLPQAIKLPFAQPWMGMYRVVNGFICDRCKENFGPVTAWDKEGNFIGWDDSYALMQDGLTGISDMACHYTAGPKPSMSYPEYEAAQTIIRNWIGLCTSFRATYVLIAHMAREPDEVEGGTKITVDTVGKKLAPRVVKPFGEIIVCRRDVDKYTWNMVDVDNMHVDQKARRLPYKANINPSFVEIFGEWKG
jgi:hypothetical protein